MKTRKNIFLLVLLFILVVFSISATIAPNDSPACAKYGEYAAFMNQYGSGDPTPTVIIDTLGSVTTWGRYSTGFYSMWSTVELPPEKTLILTSGTRGFIRVVRDPNEVFFYTWSPANALADGLLNNTWVYIKVCE